ncbi:MAG: response regulator [Bacteroidota bacterium]
MNQAIFVLGESEAYNANLKFTFELNGHTDVEVFLNDKDLLSNLYAEPQLVIMDFEATARDNQELVNMIQDLSPETKTVLLTEKQNFDEAIQYLSLNVFDIVVKDEIAFKKMNTIINTLTYYRQLLAS